MITTHDRAVADWQAAAQWATAQLAELHRVWAVTPPPSRNVAIRRRFDRDHHPEES